jgi:hypothetical protein
MQLSVSLVFSFPLMYRSWKWPAYSGVHACMMQPETALSAPNIRLTHSGLLLQRRKHTPHQPRHEHTRYCRVSITQCDVDWFHCNLVLDKATSNAFYYGQGHNTVTHPQLTYLNDNASAGLPTPQAFPSTSRMNIVRSWSSSSAFTHVARVDHLVMDCLRDSSVQIVINISGLEFRPLEWRNQCSEL